MNENKENESPIFSVDGENNLRFSHYVHLFGKINEVFNCLCLGFGCLFVLFGILFLIILDEQTSLVLSIIVLVAGILLFVILGLDLLLLPYKSYKSSKKENNHMDFYSSRLEIIMPEGNIPIVKVPYSTFYKVEEYKNAYFLYAKINGKKLGLAFSKDQVNKDGVYFLEGLKK